MRKNRIGLLQDVIQKKLKRKELIARQNKSSVTVLKFKDKRDVLMLFTMHTDVILPSQKSEIICEYNKIKGYVDLSDQMSFYTPFVQKTIKWYLKIYFHLITQTALVNAWKLYCKLKVRILFMEFKCQIIEAFLLEERRPRLSCNNHKIVKELGINYYILF